MCFDTLGCMLTRASLFAFVISSLTAVIPPSTVVVTQVGP